MKTSRASVRFARIATLSTTALLIGLLIQTTGVAAATRAADLDQNLGSATASGTVSAAVVATGSTFHAITPARILDTRSGNGLSGTFHSNIARTFQVTGRGGVPAGATAVTGNLTVTQQTAVGSLFIGPLATNNPTSSTLNFPKGDNRANGVTVALGSGGKLSITYSASPTATTHVVFDVTGYFTADASGSTFHAITPARILDTRSGNGLSGTFKSKTARTFQVTGRGGVPAGATAVTGNLTVTQQTAAGFLFIGPAATNNPTSSTLNFPKGDNRANGVTVALGSGGKLSITYSASPTATTHAVFDVTGYFTATTPVPTVTNVNPTSGPTAGGTSVTITGTNLSGATSVHFGATAGAITSNSATQVVATSPAGGAGTVDITVTTGGGTSATSSADHFTYTTPAPTVTNVNPTSGSTAGGTSVTITGTNLSTATSVHFGATAGAITSHSATQVVATSPAHAAGTVDVTVTTGGGTSATSSADHFTYTAATVTISAVGALQSHTNQPSAASEQISVSPAAAGNVLALAVEEKFPTTPAFSVATVSGGGVTTWHKALGGPTSDAIHGQELWWGTVTTPGASTITVTFTAASTAGTSESATSLDVQEFHSSIGAGTVWAVDANGVVDTGASTTTPNYPTLTPTGSHRAYFGYLSVIGSVSAGTTPGVVYQPDLRGNQCAYDVDVSAAITPTASSVASQTFFSIGMLLKAS